MSHKSVIWTYVAFRTCLHSGSWAPSCFLLPETWEVNGCSRTHQYHPIERKTRFWVALRGLYFASQFQNIWTQVNRMSNYQENPHSSGQLLIDVHCSFSGNTMIWRSLCGVRVAWLKTCTDPKNSELRKPSEHLQDLRLGHVIITDLAPVTSHVRFQRPVP